MRLKFLFGTETGTAEMLCEDLQEACAGHESAIANLEDTDPAQLEAGTLYVLVCSTFGTGDLPASAIPFAKALEKSKPDLSHVRFAIFGLGDRTFDDTFAQGSEKLMQAMLAHRATMVGERSVFDASGDELPDEIAIPWLMGIVEETQSEPEALSA